MPGPPFALFDFNLAQFLVNCLAVAGGFLVGFALTGLLVWWMDRTFFRKCAPPMAKSAARILGGLLVAILVALLVFGQGGGGVGGGKGEAIGSGTAAEGHGTAAEAQQDPGRKPVVPPTKDAPPPDGRVRVTVLGGADVKDGRFYQIDDDATPKTFAEAKAAVLAKKETGKKLAVEIRFAARNALPIDHPAVTQLAAWAKDSAGLAVVYPAGTP